VPSAGWYIFVSCTKYTNTDQNTQQIPASGAATASCLNFKPTLDAHCYQLVHGSTAILPRF
jgi:hypothetical protein